MDISKLHQLYLNSSGATTDTRTRLENKLFFALKGAHFDGNKFALEALEKGASYAIVEESFSESHPGLIHTENVLNTLQNLANFHRQYLKTTLIAITGSNGKTTTKELIAAVLSQGYTIAYTQGNLNNHIGVPLTLLQMNKATEIGIVEMGANHQGEIQRLCEIADPDYGYITNFGKAHLEGFGGIQGIIKGKSELYSYLIQKGKKIFINTEDPLQVENSKGGKLITFSQSASSDYQIKIEPTEDPFAEVSFDKIKVKSQLIGTYNAKNMSTAIAVGKHFGIKPNLIKTAIEEYVPDNNRSQILKLGENQILLDAYNANPTSMRLALENFVRYPAKRHIVILGDMFEVGPTGLQEHQDIVDLLEQNQIDRAFICGPTFSKTKITAKHINAFEDFDSLKSFLQNQQFTESIILVKGSRGMAMERVLEVLK